MDVKLIVANGKHIGEKIPVSGPKFIIGRSEDCQLRPRSDLISRHHCAIVVEDGYVAVRDFGSKNGTFVNGDRIRAEQELKNGDRLTIGQLEFLVELVVNVAGKKKPKVHSVHEAAARTVESAGDDELDLADWLNDGDTSSCSSAHAETQTISETPAKDRAVVASDTQSEEPKDTEQREAMKQTTTAPGLSALPKKTANFGDSREAAANVLKAFFNRR